MAQSSVAASMRQRLAIPTLVIATVFALILAAAWPDKKMTSRDIGCADTAPARGKQICQALSESMEWTWMGHAIVSPDWRVTWDALHRIYCREKISAADLPVLESLKQGSDWRLQDGAVGLIRLVGGGASVPENSIFSPANPHYILKGGCVGYEITRLANPTLFMPADYTILEEDGGLF
ncbi:MAG: hypothetical protein ABI833_12680 [Acidobacteriota bacterium]